MVLTMNNWLPYPKNKPSNTLEDNAKDYVALIKNPFYLKRQGSRTTPRFFPVMATWLGTQFFDDNIRPIEPVAYIVLPPFEKEIPND